MALFDRYRDLLDAGSEKLSAGFKAISNPVDKALDYKSPQMKMSLRQGINQLAPTAAQSFSNYVTKPIQKIPIIAKPMGTIAKMAGDAATAPIDKTRSLGQKIYDIGSYASLGVMPAKALPTALSSAGISSAFQAAQNTYNKKPLLQNTYSSGEQGFKAGAMTTPILSATNPLISKYLTMLSPTKSGFLASRVAPSLANVAQGVAISKATNNPITPLSIGIDALTGAVGGKGQFTVGKGAVSRQSMHPEDVAATDAVVDALRNKRISIDEKNKALITLDRLAERYLSKTEIDKLRAGSTTLKGKELRIAQALQKKAGDVNPQWSGYQLGIAGEAAQPTKGVENPFEARNSGGLIKRRYGVGDDVTGQINNDFATTLKNTKPEERGLLFLLDRERAKIYQTKDSIDKIAPGLSRREITKLNRLINSISGVGQVDSKTIDRSAAINMALGFLESKGYKDIPKINDVELKTILFPGKYQPTKVVEPTPTGRIQNQKQNIVSPDFVPPLTQKQALETGGKATRGLPEKAPIIDDFDSKRLAGEAYLGEMQGQPEFKKSFSKWIGQRDVAKTTSTQRAAAMASVPKELAWDVVRANEGTYKGNNPQVKQFAAKLKGEYDQLFKEAQDSGVDVGYLENYVTHIWAEPAEQVQAAFKSARGKFKYNKDRVLPTYEEGIKLGLTPKYNNPAEILQAYTENLEKAKANVAFIADLKKQGLVVPASVARDNPGFKAITAPGIGTNETNLGGGRTYIGTWYAPEEVANTINRVFSEPATDGFSQTVAKTGDLSGKIQDITLSGGIPGTPVNAFTLANAQKEILAGRVQSPIASFFTALSPQKSQKYFADNVETIKKMQANNIPVSTSFKIENMVDSGTKKKYGWGALMNDPTFERFMPQLQIRFFNDIEQQALKSGRSAQEAEQVAAQAVKNFYGVITSDKQALASKIGQDISKTVFFAPKFRESMVNFWVKNVKAIKNPTALENRANMKFLLGSAITYAVMDGLNYAATGNHMHQNPPGKEDKLLIPLKDEQGTVMGIPFLSSIGTVPRGAYRQGKALLTGDPATAAKDAFSTYTSSLVRPLGELASNQDYFGKKIYNPDDPTAQRYLSQGQYLAKSYMHPYMREGANVVGENLPISDQTKKNLGLSTEKTPLYQTITKAAELPIRYYKEDSLQRSVDYANDSKLKKAQDKVKAEVLKTGTEQTFGGKKYYLSQEKDSATGEIKPVVKSIKVSQTPDQIYKDLPKEYEKSPDAPQNLIAKVGTYGKGIFKDPQGTINAIKTGQPIRKVRGDAVVLERVKNLAAMDQGDKATQVDHIIPIALGGDNSESNLAIIPKQDNMAKGVVDKYLADELEAGRITKKEAQERDLNWRQEINNLPADRKRTALNWLNQKPEATTTKVDTTTLETLAKREYEPIYNNETKTYSSVSIKLPELPKSTGYAELDKQTKAKYTSALITAKKNIEKLYLDGQITAKEADAALTSIKISTTKPKKAKRGKQPKKISIKPVTLKISKSKKISIIPKTRRIKIVDKSAPKLTKLT